MAALARGAVQCQRSSLSFPCLLMNETFLRESAPYSARLLAAVLLSPVGSSGMASTVQDTGCCHSGKAILYAAGFVLGGAAIGYYIGYKYALCKARVNKKVQLANEKVVDTVDVEDIGEKKAFCRCWKSEKFPYCDGAHTKHNKETGDNVGPLLVKGKQQ